MEMVSKPCQDLFLHPILVNSIIEKKENIGSQMGHTKKNFKKTLTLKSNLIVIERKKSYAKEQN